MPEGGNSNRSGRRGCSPNQPGALWRPERLPIRGRLPIGTGVSNNLRVPNRCSSRLQTIRILNSR